MLSIHNLIIHELPQLDEINNLDANKLSALHHYKAYPMMGNDAFTQRDLWLCLTNKGVNPLHD